MAGAVDPDHKSFCTRSHYFEIGVKMRTVSFLKVRIQPSIG